MADLSVKISPRLWIKHTMPSQHLLLQRSISQDRYLSRAAAYKPGKLATRFLFRVRHMYAD